MASTILEFLQIFRIFRAVSLDRIHLLWLYKTNLLLNKSRNRKAQMAAKREKSNSWKS